MLCCCAGLFAQQVPLGAWKTHVPFRQSTRIITIGEKNYLASSAGLWSHNYIDGTMESWTRAEGLNGVSISAMDYYPAENTFVLAYSDGKIDLFKNGQVHYIPHIYQSDIQGDKTPRNLRISGSKAYIAAPFGVVVLDIPQKAILNAVRFSDSPDFSSAICFDAVEWNGYIWFATSQGLYRIPDYGNLKDLTQWELISQLPAGEIRSIDVWNQSLAILHKQSGQNQFQIFLLDQNGLQSFTPPDNQNLHRLKCINDNLLIVGDLSVMHYSSQGQLQLHYTLNLGPFTDATMNAQGQLFFSSYEKGMVRESGSQYTSTSGPARPFTSGAYKVRFSEDGTLYVLPGSISPLFVPAFRYAEFYRRGTDGWKVFFAPDGNGWVPNDFICMAFAPSSSGKIALGSAGNGVFIFKNEEFTQIFREQTFSPNVIGSFFTGGLTYDKNGNLWISQAYATQSLYRISSDNQVTAFTFPGFTGVNNMALDVEEDNGGRIWMAVPGKGIVVLDPASGNRVYLTSQFNSGDLPDLTVRCLHKDKNGEIWVGTNEGLRVFSTGNIMSGNPINGQKIVIRAEDGNNELLLGSTIINEIRSDGGNRKWIATQGAGVRLVSSDGRTIIHTFTEENSPLLSNNVYSVDIDPISGEVYFATEKGLCSFRGDATAATNEFGDVLVFPNPVRENYEGIITIKGLARNSDVRITDVSGNLVFQTRANGGTATWNGRRYDGRRPQTGVYLVFCTNEDGTESMVTKLLFIR